jgi:uncharacterized protein YkuJ
MILYGARGSWSNRCSADEVAVIKRLIQDKAGCEIMQHLMKGNGVHVVKVRMSEKEDFLTRDTQYYITVTIEDCEYDH